MLYYCCMLTSQLQTQLDKKAVKWMTCTYFAVSMITEGIVCAFT